VSVEFDPKESVLKGLRDAALRGTLIPFVGAGASRLAGCPGWLEFGDGALRQFVESGKVSHAQLDQLRDQPPRVKLSIARALQEEHRTLIDFRKLIHPPDNKYEEKGRQLFGSLSKLGRTFVTTNYDEWLDKEIVLPSLSVDALSQPENVAVNKERKVFFKVQDLTAANLNLHDAVIHLHGSLIEPKSMILTTQDYIRHYANDRRSGGDAKENLVLTFLEYLFSSKTVLFIGYGLEELEILEYVIQKVPYVSGDGQEARHYLVQGFFSHQEELMLSLKRYYLRECGIELIPYVRDKKDWDQLLDVVDELAKLTPASALMHLQEFKDMEGLLDG